VAWRERFAARLFTLWCEHDLAQGQPYAGKYDRLIRAWPVPQSVTGLAIPGCRPLDRQTLGSVYRFGAFAGLQLGRLLGLEDRQAALKSDLCGRFNLGISLFDYVCDEAGRADSLLGREPFRDLARAAGLSPASVQDEPDAAEAALIALAGGVLAEVAQVAGPPDPAGSPLWQGLVEMIGAEAGVARTRLAPGIDASHCMELVRLKSAGPFRWMANWTATGMAAGDRLAAADLGDALGALYWLVDDARDLWDDLDGRRCNLFLLAAAMEEPGLLDALEAPDFEFDLSRILLQPGWIERIAEPLVKEFAAQLARADRFIAADASGLIWRSLQRWLD
jgi:hypothetical protein